MYILITSKSGNKKSEMFKLKNAKIHRNKERN